jgi:hypothetical protein
VLRLADDAGATTCDGQAARAFAGGHLEVAAAEAARPGTVTVIDTLALMIMAESAATPPSFSPPWFGDGQSPALRGNGAGRDWLTGVAWPTIHWRSRRGVVGSY